MIELKCLTKEQQEKLIHCAEQTALRFCSPVYLVGSAVNSEYPNDIDLIIAVSGETYRRLFANYNRRTESQEDHLGNCNAMSVQQAKIYKKQKEYFEKNIKGWDFDVKFQIKEQAIEQKGEKIRLDTIYESVW